MGHWIALSPALFASCPRGEGGFCQIALAGRCRQSISVPRCLTTPEERLAILEELYAEAHAEADARHRDHVAKIKGVSDV